jgi:hypothetical protein
LTQVGDDRTLINYSIEADNDGTVQSTTRLGGR